MMVSVSQMGMVVHGLSCNDAKSRRTLTGVLLVDENFLLGLRLLDGSRCNGEQGRESVHCRRREGFVNLETRTSCREKLGNFTGGFEYHWGGFYNLTKVPVPAGQDWQ